MLAALDRRPRGFRLVVALVGLGIQLPTPVVGVLGPIGRIRLDTYVGMGYSNVISLRFGQIWRGRSVKRWELRS